LLPLTRVAASQLGTLSPLRGAREMRPRHIRYSVAAVPYRCRCVNMRRSRELAMALAQQKPDPTARRDPATVKAVVAALAAKFGNRLVTSQAVRRQAAHIMTSIAK